MLVTSSSLFPIANKQKSPRTYGALLLPSFFLPPFPFHLSLSGGGSRPQIIILVVVRRRAGITAE